MSDPTVTYIVSAYDRPEHLAVVLASLRVQTDPDFEVIVADNAPDTDMQIANLCAVVRLEDRRFQHVNTAKHAMSPSWDCYWSAEWVVDRGLARGSWLCLPSDDSYYVPIFQQVMLDAARRGSWDLVYCDILYDRRWQDGRYKIMPTRPSPGGIDKTAFFLRRSKWIGFPGKPVGSPASSGCDGEMIEQLVKTGIAHGHVPEPLVVHN